MPEENNTNEQKITNGDDNVDEEMGISDDDDVSGDENVNRVCTEDEIGVTLDYQPTNLHEYQIDSRSASTSRATSRHRRRRHRSRGQSSRRSTRSAGCTNPWVVPFLSGIFTGLIFLVIGIVFIIYFRQLPNYIGILFILVSIPPFCMAINKYRTFRHRAQMERRAELRRQVLRDMRRGGENNAYRGGSLPVPDLPPSYTNLAFDNAQGDTTVNNENEIRRNSSWSSSTEIVLPSYKDAVKTSYETKSKSRKSSNVSESDLPKYEEFEVANEYFDNSLHQPTASSPISSLSYSFNSAHPTTTIGSSTTQTILPQSSSSSP